MLMLLAIFGRERRPRVAARGSWNWTKAWASRWWLVEAETASAARELIARAEGGQFDASRPAPEGRIVDCGRHGRGGPDRSAAPTNSKTNHPNDGTRAGARRAPTTARRS